MRILTDGGKYITRDKNRKNSSKYLHALRLLLRWKKFRKLGGPGSGFHGHAGRPGYVGGSAPSGESMSGNENVPKEKDAEYQASTIDEYASKELSRFRIKDEIEKHQVSGSLSSKTVGLIIANGRAVLENHASALSSDTRGLAEGILDSYRAVLLEGLRDGSLADVSTGDLDFVLSDSIEKLIVQEIESRKRTLGDHGIRHAISNARNSLDILNSLAEGGQKITARDKLIALQTQLIHDVGFVAESQRKSFDNEIHPEISAEYARKPEYERVFGEKFNDFLETVRTHDGVDIDWEREPVKSAVRTADNFALFSREKLPDLFNRIPGALDKLAQLQLAIAGNKAQEVLPIVKADLHRLIDKSNLDKNLKEDLHHAADEVSIITGKFTLGMVAGAFDSFSFDDGVLDIYLVQRPDREILNGLFDLGERQFNKFIKAYEAKGSLDSGLELSRGGKKIYRVVTKAEMGSSVLSSLASASVRPLLAKAVRMIDFSKVSKRNRQAAFNAISKALIDKATPSEIAEIKNLILSGRDASSILGFKLTAKEQEYIYSKVELMAYLNANARILLRKSRLK